MATQEFVIIAPQPVASGAAISGGMESAMESLLMKTDIITIALLAGFTTIVGCADSSAPAKSPVDQASEVDRARCSKEVDENALQPVLSGTAIEAVEPLYGNIENVKVGPESELQGAMIRVRPVPGMTAEWLDRALECHSARRVLGKIAPNELPNDPFWLPGRTVDIDAESARDGFTVAVRGASPTDGREILERANAFRAAGPSSTSDAGVH